MKLEKILKSEQDISVNFIFDNKIESRFVRRVEDYFIVYLSSHDGCNKACRFCHLTQTKQTSFNEQTLENYVLQAKTVLEHYDSVVDSQGAAQKVNFNFMARGEPLANKVILTNAKELFSQIADLAKARNLIPHFNISSIMPDDLENVDLSEAFKDVDSDFTIYYSLYSVEPDFRKRWLPKSLAVNKALEKLEKLQKLKNNPIAFHWAFIEDENDSIEGIKKITDLISNYEIEAKFNLVRYNPYSENQGVEPKEEILERNFEELNQFFKNPKSRIVPRVGFDVKASCGMFVVL